MDSRFFGYLSHGTVSALELVIGLMPKWFLSMLAYPLARAVRLFAPKEARRIKQNVKRVYGLPEHADFSRQFVHQVLNHQAAVMLETFRELLKPGSVKISGLDSYKRAIKELREQGPGGVIIITAHLGSWEMVATTGAQQSDGDFVALAKESKYAVVTSIMKSLRSKGNTQVLWTQSKSILRDMLSAVKNKKLLGFVMDQRSPTGCVVDFMGQPTKMATGPAKIAAKTGAQVLAVMCIRKGKWQYEIMCEPVRIPQGCEKDEQKVTDLMTKVLEKYIRLYPEQWLWNYRRW